MVGIMESKFETVVGSGGEGQDLPEKPVLCCWCDAVAVGRADFGDLACAEHLKEYSTEERDDERR